MLNGNYSSALSCSLRAPAVRAEVVAAAARPPWHLSWAFPPQARPDSCKHGRVPFAEPCSKAAPAVAANTPCCQRMQGRQGSPAVGPRDLAARGFKGERLADLVGARHPLIALHLPHRHRPVAVLRAHLRRKDNTRHMLLATVSEALSLHGRQRCRTAGSQRRSHFGTTDSNAAYNWKWPAWRAAEPAWC